MKDRMSKMFGTVVLAAWTASAGAGPALDPANPGIQLPAPVDPSATKAVIKSCPDPALEGVLVRNISRQSDGAYNFIITATVRNVGAADFDSSARQQVVDIYRMSPGTSNQLVRSQAFEDLAQGRSVTVRHHVFGWRVATEFPPDYLLRISYDPDIAIDGNQANDDCRANNNKKAITGAEINRQLLASGR